MSFRPGDLVGIPFPYSNLKAEKRRPVLVITQQDRHGDFICAAVTSVPTAECAVFVDNTSMKTGHLPRRSWIRCDKLEFHIEARYPDEKKDFYKKCSEEFTTDKIDEMDKVYKWLKKRLNK